jgi:hypothetical protein
MPASPGACRGPRSGRQPPPGSLLSPATSSLAEGLLLTEDDIAVSQFAGALNAGQLRGKGLTLVIREARHVAKSINARHRANYLHFDDPLYVLRWPRAGGGVGGALQMPPAA